MWSSDEEYIIELICVNQLDTTQDTILKDINDILIDLSNDKSSILFGMTMDQIVGMMEAARNVVVAQRQNELL